MENLKRTLKLIATDKVLRNKIFFVLFVLALFRLLANIPIPAAAGLGLTDFLANNEALGFLNLVTGGGLSSISIVMLGVGPYITASIIMQLSTIMSERLKQMYHEEGELGKKKFTQFSRLLTLPLAFLQGFGLLIFLARQGVIESLAGFDMLVSVIVVASGSILLMWMGELMSEFGIGNGVSLIIFAGIVSSLPATVGQLIFTFDVSQIPLYIGFILASFLIIAGVVTITEAERPVPVTYAKRVRGSKVYGGGSTYLPLRVNQAGVIPIIFALSILIFPQVLVGFFATAANETVANIANIINNIITNPWFSNIFYFLLVFMFTYFYTAVTFDPEAIAKNLQQGGAFIPGVRPGRSTSEYLSKIITRITFVGASFLGAIAVLPLLMQTFTGVQSFAIGGTALLIVVSVVLDLIKKIQAQVTMREY